MMNQLKQIQQRLNKVKETLDLIEFSNKDYELEKIDKKYEAIKNNN